MADPNRASQVGVAAHITAAAKGGPRFDTTISDKERRSASNGIWLCAICAKEVDDDWQQFSSSVLRFWRLDAEELADQEKGRPAGSIERLRFAAIRIDPSCAWRNSHRLAKVAARVGACPQIGFHAIPHDAWAELGITDRYNPDPVLDLTLVNDSKHTSVLSSIGFEAESIWSDLKGLPQATKIHTADNCTILVRHVAVDTPQLIQLLDPISVPASSPVRIKLTLAGYAANLPGNESLIRLIAVADGTMHRSRLVNLGTY